MDDVISHENNEYYIHTFTEFVDRKNKSDWILVTSSSIGKWRDYKYLEENKVKTDNKYFSPV